MGVMLENRRPPNLLDVVDSRGESDRTGDVWRPRFKAMRCFLEQAFFQGDTHNHLSTAVPGWHRLEDFCARVEGANAGRSTHFVSGESEEIAAQRLHIEG